MKIRKFTSALIGFGLTAAIGVATAGPLDPPNTSKGEEAAFALSEAYLSLTSAVITRIGSCALAAGSRPLVLTTTADGSGQGTYDFDIVYNITRKNLVVNQNNAANGNIYDVIQAGTGHLAGIQTNAFNGDFAFGIAGAIMEGVSTYNLKEFGVFNQWDEVIIKDFWTVDSSAGKMLQDDGLEVITKLGYPRSKWRQTSMHTRPDGVQGFWSATKTLVNINNVAACTITLTGTFSQNFGGINFSGMITVS